MVIYLVSDAGSVGFGWLSSYLLRKGWSLNAARKTTMLVCALCVVPVVSVAYTDSLYVAVALVSLAAAAHQGWSAHMYTLATDMFPKRAIGSVIGFAGMLGACGSMLLSYNYKVLLNTPLGFGALFIIASGAYLTALLIIQLLVPVLRRVEEKTV